ncbi:hypothetical protein HDU93_007764 [Gonapodya sp. JEL0774]|nr:hypothetical protein HDU93_007764 [Gonapodya sp. JEL0774]
MVIGQYSRLWKDVREAVASGDSSRHFQALQLVLNTIFNFGGAGTRDPGMTDNEFANARKIASLLTASSFGKEMALWCVPASRTMVNFGSYGYAASEFARYSIYSTALQKIIAEPLFNLLSRLLDAFTYIFWELLHIYRDQHNPEARHYQLMDGETISVEDAVDHMSGALTFLSEITLHMGQQISYQYATAINRHHRFQEAFLEVWQAVSVRNNGDDLFEAVVTFVLSNQLLAARYVLAFPFPFTQLMPNIGSKAGLQLTYDASARTKDLIDSVCLAPRCLNVYLRKTCTGCGLAKYCDAKCQTVHWKMHKPVCRKDFWIVEGLDVNVAEA